MSEFKVGDWVYFKRRTSWADIHQLLAATKIQDGVYKVSEIHENYDYYTIFLEDCIWTSGFHQDWFIKIDSEQSKRALEILFGIEG